MLITKYFVFVHHQKTGGVFIKNLCYTHMPRDWIIQNSDEHPPAVDMPAEYVELPAFGLVRNPWDWYVSWFHYVMAQRERLAESPPHSPWVAVFDRGRASFADVIRAACGGVPRDGVEPPDWMDRIRTEQMDLYTRWVDQTFRGGFKGTVEIGRFEDLRNEFLGFLDRHSVPISEEFRRHALERPPDNVQPHDPYTSYYDDETRELVAATNRLVGDYGYEFGDRSPAS